MSWEHEIAKTIQPRPREAPGYYIAEIVGLDPIKLSLFGGEIYITADMMDKTERWAEVEKIGGTNRLKIGQRVAVIGSQRFLVLDRVVV